MTRDISHELSSGRVIITYGRSMMSLVIAKSLADRGVEIIGCDDVGMTVLSFSKYTSDYFVHPKWQDEPEAYLDEMVERAKKLKPKDGRPFVLMPAFNSMKFLAQHRERFDGLIDIAAPSFDAINAVDPKDHLAKTAQEIGLRIPATIDVKSREDVKRAAGEVAYPVMLKAPDGVGGRGVTKAKSPDDLIQQFEALEGQSALVQEFIEGEDYCHTVLFEQGALKASMAYKNIRQWPRVSGAGVMRETVDDASFKPLAESLLGPLKWNGIAEIDFRWSGNQGDPAYLIEVNPRFWAGLFHSVTSGVDYPWALYELTVTGKVTAGFENHIGERTRVPGVALLSALTEIAESEIHFDRLRDGWRRAAARAKEGHVGEAVKIFSRNVGRIFDGDDAAFDLMEALHAAREAKSEISLEEDGIANMGFLYVVSSLIRHGELPPELKH